MCGASGSKISLSSLFKIRGDEVGGVGLDKGDLGWGREWGWGEGVGEVR